MAKQKELEGFERKKIQEIEDRAGVYEKTMTKRVKLTKEENADKLALIEVMKKNGVASYKLDSGQIVVVGTGKPTVKITEAEEEGAEDEDGAGKEAGPAN